MQAIKMAMLALPGRCERTSDEGRDPARGEFVATTGTCYAPQLL